MPLPDHSAAIQDQLAVAREKIELLIRRAYQLAGNEGAEAFAQVRLLASDVRREIDALAATVTEEVIP